jgi:type II restriction/modification system DNA methylase subunit YeeA
MREFISYAVGCMFGRYSLDKPGLILANQGETVADYLQKVSGNLSFREESFPSASGKIPRLRQSSIVGMTWRRRHFPPDRDNAIPMLDGDWFSDDITERFKKFLRVTFGEAHYEENLAFIEAALGRDVRSYFLREFYNHHVKMYKKRPIYWLFSSAKGSFNVLIYMHRYRPDTVSIVLNDYLREFRAKLTARKSHLEGVSVSASATPRDKTQALKEVAAIDKILQELRDYEDDILYPLATQPTPD